MSYRSQQRRARQARWEHLQGLTAADLEAFRAQIEATPAVITIVGDRAAIDGKALRKLGRVQIVDPKHLFACD